MTREAVRALLNRDRPWAVYALGDLAPEPFAHCTWWKKGESLGLLYRGFSTPIFWADGPVDLPFDEPALILQIREEMVPAIRAIYPQVTLKKMLRMALQGTPEPSTAVRLGQAHLPAIERLYAAPDGPDFFHATMLDQGVFYGAWQDDQLIAAAGTHILNIEESAAAIGNVYTHPDHRGRGHAARLTAAVACELRRLGIQTIALSVAAANPAAITIYTRLGFQPHCPFYEGFASTGRTA
ncbi:MAG: GNAT family N-acetyltransferase [Bryobacterales bacterium]|nr:GNAT family N-acetyltransferase [Bryobacterales bacterium]